jgi:hypothetical protein
MTAPEPTAQDLHNAAIRAEIAARQNAAYQEAEQLATQVLGPEYLPWMKLTLIDSDHRRTGDTTPIATAFKVYRGEARLTGNSVFLRRMPDGDVRHADNYEELFGELLTEKHPTRTVEVQGRQVPAGKYELCWAALERYEPRSPAALAAARVKREERAVERLAVANPLFQEQIRAEQARPERSKRGRSA